MLFRKTTYTKNKPRLDRRFWLRVIVHEKQVKSTQYSVLGKTCNFSSMGLDALFWSLHAYICIYSHRHTNKNTFKDKKLASRFKFAQGKLKQILSILQNLTVITQASFKLVSLLLLCYLSVLSVFQ